MSYGSFDYFAIKIITRLIDSLIESISEFSVKNHI